MELGYGTAFVAGILTFASPCVLPLIPIYLGILAGSDLEEVARERRARFRLIWHTAAFAAGFLPVFVLLGLSVTAAGRFFLSNKLAFQQIGGLLVFAFGLKFLGYLKIPFLDREARIDSGRLRTRMPALNAFLFGVFFAFGWTPCIGPILGSILTLAATSGVSPATGASLLLVYGLGFAVPIVLTSVFLGLGLPLLRKTQRFLPVFERVTGVILIVLAGLMVTDSLSALTMEVNVEVAAGRMKDSPHHHVTAGQPDGGGPSVARSSGATCAIDHDSSAPGTCGGAAEPSFVAAGPQEGLDLARKLLNGLPPGKATMIEFYSHGCPRCMQMVPVMRLIENACRDIDVQIVKLDLAAESNRKLARTFGVPGIPTFVFMDAKGAEVARLIGVQKPSALRHALAVASGEICADYARLPAAN